MDFRIDVFGKAARGRAAIFLSPPQPYPKGRG